VVCAVCARRVFSYEDVVTFPVHVPLILDDAYAVASGGDEPQGEDILPPKSPPRLSVGSEAPPDAAPFDAVPFDAAPFDAAPFDAVPFDAAPFDAVPFDAAPFDEPPFGSLSAEVYLQMHGGHGVFL
jgi:hypothetical protein